MKVEKQYDDWWLAGWTLAYWARPIPRTLRGCAAAENRAPERVDPIRDKCRVKLKKILGDNGKDSYDQTIFTAGRESAPSIRVV